MNNGISIREFARREGVSDTLVRRAVKQGRLRLSEDKSIDPSLVGSAWREGNAVGAKPSAPGANTTANRREQVFAPAAAPSDSASRANEESLEERADRLLDSGVVDMLPYGQALERKENYLALLRKLEYEEKSGALVSLELAERALFEGARAARDAWLNWPARVGPLIAADLGLEADLVTEALTQHVHKHIGQLGEPDVHFDADQ
ncbi:hypothetical protein DyAD56_15910 [Dyella sp. AD56]|uniref:hypothetical protein n=1 Tax=Dyella sp. AD56 TaxID=1528744 RepID=UPI000C82C894|nr:hypothetical protein [Dyella sp. AD56]PMQ04173.1 hypothetical protein DyAD56_15910 [Dyella sp. AD56]